MEKEFWDNRWLNQQLGWDIGEVSRPLKEYFDQIKDKSIKILIPGAGNSYEAEYLHQNGFENVYVADISAHALQSFKDRCPDFQSDKMLNIDFFQLEDQFDLIVEQTFFCAIHPSRRAAYAQKMKTLLAPGGKLAGVLFDRSFDAGPPFGGNKKEYLEIFEPVFSNITIIPCNNSISSRMGTELWIEIQA